jgi:hypothetical protein
VRLNNKRDLAKITLNCSQVTSGRIKSLLWIEKKDVRSGMEVANADFATNCSKTEK